MGPGYRKSREADEQTQRIPDRRDEPLCSEGQNLPTQLKQFTNREKPKQEQNPVLVNHLELA